MLEETRASLTTLYLRYEEQRSRVKLKAARGGKKIKNYNFFCYFLLLLFFFFFFFFTIVLFTIKTIVYDFYTKRKHLWTRLDLL